MPKALLTGKVDRWLGKDPYEIDGVDLGRARNIQGQDPTVALLPILGRAVNAQELALAAELVNVDRVEYESWPNWHALGRARKEGLRKTAEW